MLIQSKEKLIELINNSIPYPNQVKNWDFSSEDKAVRFEWRSNKFRVDLDYCSVEEVGDGVLMGSDISILLTQLLKNNIGSILE